MNIHEEHQDSKEIVYLLLNNKFQGQLLPAPTMALLLEQILGLSTQATTYLMSL
jgi:hypothetical protein